MNFPIHICPAAFGVVDTGEMLMLHGEDGGMKTGVFEYTLGAKEDGPIREDGKLVMDIITAE
ncbi:hypothetical protein L6J37_15060 [Photobacterium sp. WH77]|uniref:hypothetical protein n=1 Tax=Photobacterium TaxID=657 RepID=UPI001EDB1BEE|nr:MULTISPECIES: hypothetical protein [Photobacterium]MCG2838152.1 hypothetical protein [Photobacterium sp. WH77]MCG2845770.1 hypothetical protein [Photobacterium sp. WH80]